MGAEVMTKPEKVELSDAQRAVVEAIVSGRLKRTVVQFPRAYGKSFFYQQLAKRLQKEQQPFKPVTKSLTIFTDEYEDLRARVKSGEISEHAAAFKAAIHGNWVADRFGIDWAYGRDKSVIVKVPKS